MTWLQFTGDNGLHDKSLQETIRHNSLQDKISDMITIYKTIYMWYDNSLQETISDMITVYRKQKII